MDIEEKKRLWRKNWYYKNRKRAVATSRKNKEKYVAAFKEYKKKFSCAKCGEADPRCIDFHHINQDEKIKNVSVLGHAGQYKKALKEIEKCIALCSNCHRKETFDL